MRVIHTRQRVFGDSDYIFVNKMDQDQVDKKHILEEIHNKLDGNCVDFSNLHSEEWFENMAMCDEGLMDIYLEKN